MLTIRVSAFRRSLLAALSLLGLRRRRAVFPVGLLLALCPLALRLLLADLQRLCALLSVCERLELDRLTSLGAEDPHARRWRGRGASRPGGLIAAARTRGLAGAGRGRSRGAQRFDPVFGRGQCLSRAFCRARSARCAHRVVVGAPWLQGHACAVQVETDALIDEGAEEQPTRQRVFSHIETNAPALTDGPEVELVERR